MEPAKSVRTAIFAKNYYITLSLISRAELVEQDWSVRLLLPTIISFHDKLVYVPPSNENDRVASAPARARAARGILTKYNINKTCNQATWRARARAAHEILRCTRNKRADISRLRERRKWKWELPGPSRGVQFS